jgi:hypothetical protein
MMTAMRTVEEKPDCASPETATDAKANDHGKKEEHEAKPADHGAKPEEAHGEKPAEDHGEKPAKDGANEAAQGEQPAKEESFLDSMLSMVGLGGSEERPAIDDSHAVAEEPVEDPGAHPVAEGKDAEKAATDHAETSKEAEAHDVVAPVKKDPAEPAEAEDHAQPKKAKADEHAEASMPVGD